jgi:hypothetical protein
MFLEQVVQRATITWTTEGRVGLLFTSQTSWNQVYIQVEFEVLTAVDTKMAVF